VVNETPVNLLKATEAFIASSTPGKVKIITRSFSPSSAYGERCQVLLFAIVELRTIKL
jgi:hypothetical protein